MKILNVFLGVLILFTLSFFSFYFIKNSFIIEPIIVLDSVEEREFVEFNDLGFFSIFTFGDIDKVDNPKINKIILKNINSIAGVNTGSCFYSFDGKNINFYNCTDGIFKRVLENSLNIYLKKNKIPSIKIGETYYVEKN